MFKLAIILFLSCTVLLPHATGQTFNQQFRDLLSKKDTVGQRILLEKWEATNQNDPELYVAYFNYYVQKSRKEIVRLDNNPNGSSALQIMNNDTSKKDPVGYMYSEITYEPELLKKGFFYVDKGIEKFPTRLDMRFGKIYMYGQIQDFASFTNAIVLTIDYSMVILNKWTWTDNKPVENPQNFMLGSLQDYQVQLYNTGNESLLDNMRKIAETVLKYYPDDVESLSNLSVTYLLKKEYDKALVPLLRAEKLAPTDYIVLSNIAQAYKLQGDSKNAVVYYKLVIINGDDQAKEYAKSQVAALEKK